MLIGLKRNLPGKKHGDIRQVRPNSNITHAESLSLQIGLIGLGGELLVEDSEELVHYSCLALLLHEN